MDRRGGGPAGDKALFPPLLGTGGNDGRLDFSTNFHEQLLAVLGRPQARVPILWRRPVICWPAPRPNGWQTRPSGSSTRPAQADQGLAVRGSASLVNPWGYVLLWRARCCSPPARRGATSTPPARAAMPFTVQFSPDGSASGAEGEDSRGEVWAPVWSQAFTLAEVRQLFGEARASWRGRPARRAVDFYAATRTLGVARGISEFVRYGLQQRNGLAFVAVPLDRVEVVNKPEVRLAAKIEDWVSWIPRGDASRAVGTALRSSTRRI